MYYILVLLLITIIYRVLISLSKTNIIKKETYIILDILEHVVIIIYSLQFCRGQACLIRER